MGGPEAGQTERDIERLAAALGDPTRRRIFFFVRQAGRPVSKDEVAAEMGIERRLAAFHLDKLVDKGFLKAEFRRTRPGGPGAGRPPKLYSLAETELSVSLRERHYDLLATLLLRAVQDRSGEPEAVVLERIGFEFGRQIGLDEIASRAGETALTTSPTAAREAATEAMQEVVRVLSRYGFAAHVEGGDGIKACACPFEEVAFDDPDRICGLDRAIWRGVLSAFVPGATLSDTTTRARGDEACLAHVVTA